ncbi:DnaJ-domain-containing protein [Amniculicola lignicola CBS 123094]|uniref:DnaJ-domain-containing protein n=1 Tax=Amniculicola lignicola CBS 123094 TaxID=1392246 RepID=A0A6A5WZ50_9PLEO|nr:DnaJ-domain-containing protein [Amniculicola lignicola CBS 123094]
MSPILEKFHVAPELVYQSIWSKLLGDQTATKRVHHTNNLHTLLKFYALAIHTIHTLPTRPAMTDRSYYDELVVEPTATLSDIRKAFYKLSRDCHPDRTQHLHPDECNARTERFKIINNAYEVLRDQDKREWYDRNEMEQRAGHDPDAYTWRDNGTYNAEPEDDKDRDEYSEPGNTTPEGTRTRIGILQASQHHRLSQ